MGSVGINVLQVRSVNMVSVFVRMVTKIVLDVVLIFKMQMLIVGSVIIVAKKDMFVQVVVA